MKLETNIRELAALEAQLAELEEKRAAVREAIMAEMNGEGIKTAETQFGTVQIRETPVYDLAGFQEVQDAKIMLKELEATAKKTAPFTTRAALVFNRNKAVIPVAGKKNKVYVATQIQRKAVV